MVFDVVTGMDMLQSCAKQSLYGVVDTGMNMSQSCTQLGLYGVVDTGMNMSQSCTQQGLYGVVDTGMNMSQSCTQLGLYVGCCCGCCGNTLGVTRYRFVIARCQMYARVCVFKFFLLPHHMGSQMPSSEQLSLCFSQGWILFCTVLQKMRNLEHAHPQMASSPCSSTQAHIS